MDKDKGRIKETLPLNVIYFVSHSTQAAVLGLFCPVLTLFLASSWVVLPVPCLFLGCSGRSWVVPGCSVF